VWLLLAQALKGHGKEINDLAVHPTEPELVLSGSKVSTEGVLRPRLRAVLLWYSLHICIQVKEGSGQTVRLQLTCSFFKRGTSHCHSTIDTIHESACIRLSGKIGGCAGLMHETYGVFYML
jgi:hypothetical protein